MNLRTLSPLLLLSLLFCTEAFPQPPSAPANPEQSAGVASTQLPPALSRSNVEQFAKIVGATEELRQLNALQEQRACGERPSMDELLARQQLSDTALSVAFDVDSVAAEIDNERAQLIELRSALNARRDHTVSLLNVANLITGTGIGIAVNAMQFSSATANIGNGLGVGSGAASTILSIIGLRKQTGPSTSIATLPNMLAPLFNRPPALNTYYPPAVLEYLRSAPPSEGAQSSTRLELLQQEWRRTGRLAASGTPANEQKIARLSAAQGNKVKLTSDDLSDRIAMLTDVEGRVGLMKRDLAALMRFSNTQQSCSH